MEKENKSLKEKETHWMAETDWERTGEEDWECIEWTGRVGFETKDVKQAVKDYKEFVISKLFGTFKLLPEQLQLVEEVLNEADKNKFGFEL